LNGGEKGAFAEYWADKADLIEFQTYRHVCGSEVPRPASAPLPRRICLEGIKRGMLWPNGDITPCCAGWAGLVFGNIVDGSFEDIWNGAAAAEIRGKLRRGTGLPEVCVMCLQGNRP
jgi:hypothetical protein